MPLLGCMLRWNLESFDVAGAGDPISGKNKPGVDGNVWLGWWTLVAPRPLFSSVRRYKSVRPPWHVLIQRCSTVQSPSSPDSISVFGMETNFTARFTICDLVSLPVNIGCLFLSCRIIIGAVDPGKTLHQLRACTIDILEVISSFSWISRFVSRPQRNILALNQLWIWESCDQLAILGNVRAMAVSDCSKRGNMKAGQESFSVSKSKFINLSS